MRSSQKLQVMLEGAVLKHFSKPKAKNFGREIMFDRVSNDKSIS